MNYETLYRENYLRFVWYANSKIGNWHDAEDIVQDVFIKFFTLKEDKDVKDNANYLFKMVKNTCINYIARKERYKKCLNYIESNSIVEDTVSKYDEQFLLTKVYKAITKMKECQYKTILKLHYIRGKSFAEISKELSIAKKMIFKSRVFGVNKLKETIGN